METPSTVIMTLESQSYPSKKAIYLTLAKRLGWTKLPAAISRCRRLEAKSEEFAREILRVLQHKEKDLIQIDRCPDYGNAHKSDWNLGQENESCSKEFTSDTEQNCEEQDLFDEECDVSSFSGFEDNSSEWQDKESRSIKQTVKEQNLFDKDCNWRSFCDFKDNCSDQWLGNKCRSNEQTVEAQDLVSEECYVNSFSGFEDSNSNEWPENKSRSNERTVEQDLFIEDCDESSFDGFEDSNSDVEQENESCSNEETKVKQHELNNECKDSKFKRLKKDNSDKWQQNECFAIQIDRSKRSKVNFDSYSNYHASDNKNQELKGRAKKILEESELHHKKRKCLYGKLNDSEKLTIKLIQIHLKIERMKVKSKFMPNNYF